MKKSKKQNGTTLVALIITIIILIILAAIVIKEVIDHQIVTHTIKATETYSEEQNKETKMLNEMKDITSGENKEPKLIKEVLIERTENTIKVKALANDEDGDKITYILYIKQEGRNWQVGAIDKDKISGEEIVLIAKNLMSDEKYIWKVEITDNKTKITSSEEHEVRTLCCNNATICEGAYNMPTICENCSNKGTIIKKCNQKINRRIYKEGYFTGTSGQVCYYCSKRLNNTKYYQAYNICSDNHEISGRRFYCSEAHGEKDNMGIIGTNCSWTQAINCEFCGGKIYCVHGFKKEKEHYYCNTHNKVL